MALCEVIVGTYEELVVGYQLKKSEEKYELIQSFTNHSHTGSVGFVAASESYLATGSSDETINLFHSKKRVECGSLVHHEGTVNCIKFHEDTHLLSCSDDGTICVWTTNNWQCLKTLRGHKKAVTHISIHPSGKIALSLSKDCTLRTWNLIKGRSAYVTNIKTAGSLVEWSTTGRLYAVVIGNKVDIYSCELAGVVHTIDFGKRISAILFIGDESIAIGGEGGTIEIHSTEKEALKNCFEAHKARIKSLALVANPNDDEKYRFLVTTSSDGCIKIWKMNVEKLDETPEFLTAVETGCRINCSAVVTISRNTGKNNAKIKNVEEAKVNLASEETEHLDESTAVRKRRHDSEKNLKKRKQLKKV